MKGGVYITGDAEAAFSFFIQNSKSAYLSKGANGIVIVCMLNNGVVSPYHTFRAREVGLETQVPIKRILIKLLCIDDEPGMVVLKKDSVLKIQTEKDFTRETNIQTEIFLKTLDYLDPVVPAPVYANVLDKVEGLKLLESIDVHERDVSDMIQLFIKAFKRPTFNHVGIISMEYADGYKPLYTMGGDPEFRNFEYMARVKILELALKTGYTQADFHGGNIMVNKNAIGHFSGVKGNVLIIDFGYSVKIHQDEMTKIKKNFNSGNYYNALKNILEIPRSDDLELSDPLYIAFYGWLLYKFDSLTKRTFNLSEAQKEEFNENMKVMIDEQNQAIDERIQLYNTTRQQLIVQKSDPSILKLVPLLPLSTSVRKQLFKGYLPVITEVYSQNETSHESQELQGSQISQGSHKSLNRRPFSDEFPFQNMYISPQSRGKERQERQERKERKENSYLPHFNKMASKQLKSLRKVKSKRSKSKNKSKSKTKAKHTNKTNTNTKKSNSMFKSFFKSMFK